MLCNVTFADIIMTCLRHDPLDVSVAGNNTIRDYYPHYDVILCCDTRTRCGRWDNFLTLIYLGTVSSEEGEMRSDCCAAKQFD